MSAVSAVGAANLRFSDAVLIFYSGGGSNVAARPETELGGENLISLMNEGSGGRLTNLPPPPPHSLLP